MSRFLTAGTPQDSHLIIRCPSCGSKLMVLRCPFAPADRSKALEVATAAMGIRDRPIAPHSPWQNGYAERLIGSIRRDCLDHVIVVGERHLRHLLKSYQKYYNEARTHLSLEKDAPIPRAVQGVRQTLAVPILGGLHHQYPTGTRLRAVARISLRASGCQCSTGTTLAAPLD